MWGLSFLKILMVWIQGVRCWGNGAQVAPTFVTISPSWWSFRLHLFIHIINSFVHLFSGIKHGQVFGVQQDLGLASKPQMY